LCAAKFRQRRIVDCAFRFGWIFVAGEECHVRVMRTVRHWDACVGRSGDSRCDSRHNFKRDSRSGDFLRFFCASAKHEWIAAF
jgi:hypothetical protein